MKTAVFYPITKPTEQDKPKRRILEKPKPNVKPIRQFLFHSNY